MTLGSHDTKLEQVLRRAFAKLGGRDRIRLVLEALGYSLASAAIAIGTAPETLSRVLAGEDSPRAIRIREDLARLVGVTRGDIDKLIDG